MPPDIIKGLKDVYFDTTESSFIDGIEGKLLYRGYNIHDLAEKSTFEEVVYLLLYGKLPNKKELADFDAVLRANRIIPDDVIQVLDLIKASHPMDALRTGISALSAFEPEVNDNSVEATIRKGIRLRAIFMTSSAAPPCAGPFKVPTPVTTQEWRSEIVDAVTLAAKADALGPCSACRMKSTSSRSVVSWSGSWSKSM